MLCIRNGQRDRETDRRSLMLNIAFPVGPQRNKDGWVGYFAWLLCSCWDIVSNTTDAGGGPGSP